MNILFLSIGNLNSIEDKGIYTDLLRRFRNNGHRLHVVSSRERRLNMPTEYVDENGVNFLRIKIGNITKTNLVEKGISTIMVEHLFLKRINKYLSDIRFDLVIYSTPPITFEKIIRHIKKRDGAKTYLLLKDIFPQNAVDLGMFSKKGLLYRYFRNKEKKLYLSSDYIGCMSKANVEFILKQNPNISRDIVEICPNSIEPVEQIMNRDKIREVKDKYNIPHNRMVLIYGGNLGRPQGIDFLIECMKSNNDNERVYFIIVGSGTKFDKLKNYFEDKKPQNAQLFNQLPKNEYEMLVNSCDIGLIFLDKRFTIPNFPSRLLSYMQASMPVLAATDINTDIGRVLEEGEFGFWCESGDIDEFNSRLGQLYDLELRKRMGINARRYLGNHYTSRHSYEVIMKHFE